MDKLEINITDDLITGKKRKLIHRQLRILPDLEMAHDMEIVYYEQDGTTPTLEAIRDNGDLTISQKSRVNETFRNVRVSVSTKDVWVNPDGSPSNKEDEGSIKERDFWQLLPLGLFPEETTIAGVMYKAIEMSMHNLNNTQRL